MLLKVFILQKVLNLQIERSSFNKTNLAMKKYLLFSIFSLLFIYSNSFSQGFNSITTPDGINVIAVGDNGNMFRSSNGGATWSKNIVAGYNFKSIASYNNSVWIATGDGKIVKTFKGQSALNPSSLTASSLNGVTFVDEQTGYTCGSNGVVFRTVNGGANWEARNSGISNTVKLNSISFIDANNGVTVGDGGMIYVTTNGGQTWTSNASSTTRNLLKAKYFTDGICVVGEYGTLLQKPTTGSWSAVNTKILTDIRGVSGMNFSSIRVCGGGGFIRGNSGSSANFQTFEPNPMMANLVDIFYYNATTGFSVSSMNDAIIKTTNSGTSWDLTASASVVNSWVLKLSASSGIGNTLCQHPSKRDEMFVVYGKLVYVSRNRGETWTQIATIQGAGISSNPRAHSFYINPIDTNIMVAAVENSPTDCVVKSTNYGANWTVSYSQNFSAYGQPLEQDQNNPSTYYFVPDGGGFYKSTDFGSTFTQISAYPFSSPCDITIMYDSASVIYIGESSPSRVYKSTNYGVNWVLNMSASGSEIPSIANSTFDKKIAYATAWSTSTVWKTTNYGDNWFNLFSMGGSGWGSDICREDPNMYIAGAYGGPSSITINGGQTWFPNVSVSNSGAGAIAMEKNYILLQQTSNVYKLNSVYTAVTSVQTTTLSNTVPSKFDLQQNYPNPFNPVTNIKFDVVNTGNVKLIVYNQLGKEVETLIDGVTNAGSYEVQFDASKLNSGVYFYKLQSDNVSLTKKMLLVK